MVDIVVETGSGSATANSYCSVSDGDTYHERRLHTSTWDDSDDETKERGLMWATQLLDSLVGWYGQKTSDTQALEWPRSGVVDRNDFTIDNDTIPSWLKDATAEFARLLIAEDRTAEPDTLGFKFMKADVLEAEIDPRDRRGILPPSVGALVAAYGQVGGGGGTRFAKAVRA